MKHQKLLNFARILSGQPPITDKLTKKKTTKKRPRRVL